MKKIILIITTLLIISFQSAFAQIDSVAVISVWANRSIDASDFQGLSMAIENLSRNENFKLDSMLSKVHDELFDAYAKEFPFKLMDEKEVLDNDDYSQILENTTLKLSEWQVSAYENYLAIESRSPVRNKKAITNALQLFKKADGVMIVILHYRLKKKTEIVGFGTAVVEAYVNIQLFDRDGKSVLKIKERAESNETFKFALGGEVFEVEEIQKLCEQSTTNLLKDMYEILPKRLIKMKKKISKKKLINL